MKNAVMIVAESSFMLIKISALREKCNMKELIKRSQESGRKYMNVASAFFGEEK